MVAYLVVTQVGRGSIPHVTPTKYNCEIVQHGPKHQAHNLAIEGSNPSLASSFRIVTAKLYNHRNVSEVEKQKRAGASLNYYRDYPVLFRCVGQPGPYHLLWEQDYVGSNPTTPTNLQTSTSHYILEETIIVYLETFFQGLKYLSALFRSRPPQAQRLRRKKDDGSFGGASSKNRVSLSALSFTRHQFKVLSIRSHLIQVPNIWWFVTINYIGEERILNWGIKLAGN